MQAKITIMEIPDDGHLGLCLAISENWTEDARFKVAIREDEPGGLTVKTIVRSLRVMAEHIESHERDISAVLSTPIIPHHSQDGINHEH